MRGYECIHTQNQPEILFHTIEDILKKSRIWTM